ncbi:MAG: heavy metal-binding domain-containing protein [Pedobacter sp.]|uniref:heavy metal-binding domain-containing protein n=1 Tax=Pedobacter sp. TaxID=1411316 RepID=UPI0035686D80
MRTVINTLLSLTVCLITLSACNNTENKINKDMTTHQHTEKESVYACPMHPEVTGKQGEKCPKCGMDLKAVNPENTAAYAVQLTTSPQNVEAEKPTKLMLAVKKEEKIVSLDISHEMKIHLMVVSEDLTWFRHIHPEEQKDGTYVISETFPTGGKYLLFTDFKPSGGEQTLNKKEIEVQGKSSPVNNDVSTKYISKVDGYTVTLTNGSDFKTNKTQHLEISIEKDGKKLIENDLQQYLGASAHIVMIGKVGKEFLHIHPVSDSRFPVFAQTHIEKAGVYRMWAQFKIDGKVHTADFTVDVAEGKKGENEEKSHAHQH